MWEANRSSVLRGRTSDLPERNSRPLPRRWIGLGMVRDNGELSLHFTRRLIPVECSLPVLRPPPLPDFSAKFYNSSQPRQNLTAEVGRYANKDPSLNHMAIADRSMASVVHCIHNASKCSTMIELRKPASALSYGLYVRWPAQLQGKSACIRLPIVLHCAIYADQCYRPAWLAASDVLTCVTHQPIKPNTQVDRPKLWRSKRLRTQRYAGRHYDPISSTIRPGMSAFSSIS